jgi:hypothetical protein
MSHPVIPIVAPNLADELAAGRPAPVRDFREQLNHQTATAHLRAMEGWWLAVAEGYCDLAAKALANGDVSAADEIVRDGQAAFAQARRYAPQDAS